MATRGAIWRDQLQEGLPPGEKDVLHEAQLDICLRNCIRATHVRRDLQTTCLLLLRLKCKLVEKLARGQPRSINASSCMGLCS